MTGTAVLAAVALGIAVALGLPSPGVTLAVRRGQSRPTDVLPEGWSVAGSWGQPGSLGRRQSRIGPALALLGGPGVGMLVGGVLGMVLGVVFGAVLFRMLSQAEPAASRRRRESLRRSLPHAVDLMASSLAVGASPSRAVGLVATAVEGPISEELEHVSARLRLGVDPVRVWAELGRHPELGPLGRCLVRALDSGASVSEAMHRLAEDVRRSARADVEARARAVGVKAAAPLGLCLLPAFILTGVVPLVAGSAQLLLTG